MYKKIAVRTLVAVLLIVPVAATAQSASDLQQRIQELLEQVRQLQQQLKQTNNTAIPPEICPAIARICPDGTIGVPGPGCSHRCPNEITPLPLPGNRVCLPILRDLVRGARGEDVKSLQDFLRQEGFFTENPTGFFGEMTEAALKRWQAKEGIVSFGSPVTTGWGHVGPRTRLVIRNRCVPPDSLQVSPRTGNAPLTVTFAVQLKPGQGYTYALDFGDGSSQAVTATGATTTIAHTYTANGMYIATLTQNHAGGCPGNPPGCLGQPASSKVIGKASLIVGPVTATDPPRIVAIVGPSFVRAGATTTWKVATSIVSGDTKFSVVWGDETAYDRLLGLSSGTVQNSEVFTHTYARPGTYTAVFSASNPKGTTTASWPVTVNAAGGGGGNSGGSFTASPTTGNKPLNVQFSYTTTGNTAYIVFGDGTTGSATVCAESFPMQCSVAHTYANAGTYTASLIDRVNGVLQIVKSITITVQ